MQDPVLAADGFSYERAAIEDWFAKGHRTSPKTGLQLLHPSPFMLKLCNVADMNWSALSYRPDTGGRH